MLSRLRSKRLILRPTTACSLIKRTYYDSQSGTHVERNLDFHLYSSSASLDTNLSTGVSIPYHSIRTLQQLQQLPVDSSSSGSASGVTLDLDISTFHDHRTTIVELIAEAKAKKNTVVRINLLNVFRYEPQEIQTISGILFDTNVDVLVLDDQHAQVLCLDDDVEDALYLLQEMLESLTWLDVVGTPVLDRLCLCVDVNVERNRALVESVLNGGDEDLGIVLPVVRRWCGSGQEMMKLLKERRRLDDDGDL
jgi:hypothetical protein